MTACTFQHRSSSDARSTVAAHESTTADLSLFERPQCQRAIMPIMMSNPRIRIRIRTPTGCYRLGTPDWPPPSVVDLVSVQHPALPGGCRRARVGSRRQLHLPYGAVLPTEPFDNCCWWLVSSTTTANHCKCCCLMQVQRLLMGVQMIVPLMKSRCAQVS